MSYVDKNIDTIQGRIDYLTQKIDELPTERTGFLFQERKALQWALQYIQDEQSNVNEARAFKKGQVVILKNYKKILKKAVKNDGSQIYYLVQRKLLAIEMG